MRASDEGFPEPAGKRVKVRRTLARARMHARAHACTRARMHTGGGKCSCPRQAQTATPHAVRIAQARGARADWVTRQGEDDVVGGEEGRLAAVDGEGLRLGDVDDQVGRY